MNSLLPEIIAKKPFKELEETFFQRLKNSRYEIVFLEIQSISNLLIIDLMAEMYGVPKELFSLENYNLNEFLQFIIALQNSNMSKDALKRLVVLLGASNIVVENAINEFTYNGDFYYDGTMSYDGGESASKFALELNIYGVNEENQSQFEANFRSLFGKLMPIHLYIDVINFY